MPDKQCELVSSSTGEKIGILLHILFRLFFVMLPSPLWNAKGSSMTMTLSSSSLEKKKVMAKIHHDPSGEKVLALIDRELIGETLMHPKKKKKIIPSEKFYGGKEIDIHVAMKLLFSYQNVNAFGSVIEFAIEQGRLVPDIPIWFEMISNPEKKVPHLMVFDVSHPKKPLKSELL